MEELKTLLPAKSDIPFYDKNKTNVYPSIEKVYTVFQNIKPENIKVIILGQDPYHTPDKANGRAFAISQNNAKLAPPSLKNIVKELVIEGFYDKDNVNKTFDYTLLEWEKQGVMMLNSALTVEEGNPMSHAKYWAPITDKIIKHIAEMSHKKVFMLWGNFAHKKAKYICKSKYNLVLKSGHPSPLSCKRFFNNNHFTTCNDYLADKAIKW